MFKKAISGLSLAAAAFGLAAFSAPAAACTDTNNDWDCIHPGDTKSATATYYGSATLSHWYTGTFWCNAVKATGTVTIDTPNTGDATLDISNFADNGSISSAKCQSVGFEDFDWSGTHNGTGSPNSNTSTTSVDFEVSTPRITYNGTTVCQDSVTVTFANDGSGGSTFSFNDSISGWAGSCTIVGELANSGLSAH